MTLNYFINIQEGTNQTVLSGVQQESGVTWLSEAFQEKQQANIKCAGNVRV